MKGNFEIKKENAKKLFNSSIKSFHSNGRSIKILRKEEKDNIYTVYLEVKKDGKNIDMTELNPFIFVNPPINIVVEEAIIDTKSNEPKVIKKAILEENPDKALKSIISDTLGRVLWQS